MRAYVKLRGLGHVDTGYAYLRYAGGRASLKGPDRSFPAFG